VFAVIDEAVADPRTSWKRGQVTGNHTVQISIDPCVDFSLDHVDELFLVRLGVRPGRARAGRQPLQVDAQTHEARDGPEAAHRAHGLVAVRVDVRALRQVGGGDDEGWAWDRGHAPS